MHTFTYQAVFERGENPDVIVVTFPDVPEAITQGDGEADARAMASDAFGVALLGLLSLRKPIPRPSKRRPGQIPIGVVADVAATVAVVEAFQAAGITQTEFAARLGKDGREVRRILDPDHATKFSALMAALAALGHRLAVGIEAA